MMPSIHDDSELDRDDMDWGRFACVFLGVVFIMAVCIWLAMSMGCAFTQSERTLTAEGIEHTKSIALGFLGGDVHEATSSETTRATSASHRPDETTVLMRPVVMAGVALLVLGGILTLMRWKIKVVPLGASIGLMGLGVGMILLGAFVVALGPWWPWIVIGGGVLAALMWGPALIANLREWRQGRQEGSET